MTRQTFANLLAQRGYQLQPAWRLVRITPEGIPAPDPVAELHEELSDILRALKTGGRCEEGDEQDQEPAETVSHSVRTPAADPDLILSK